jgi:hypothetical protein
MASSPRSDGRRANVSAGMGRGLAKTDLAALLAAVEGLARTRLPAGRQFRPPTLIAVIDPLSAVSGWPLAALQTRVICEELSDVKPPS